MKAQAAATEQARTPSMPTAGDTVTLRNTQAARLALGRHAEREGLELPDKVGEKYGWGIRIVVERNVTQPDGARNAVDWLVDGQVVETWTYEEAGSEVRKLDKLGADRGEYNGVMYRGQNGGWRLRVKM